MSARDERAILARGIGVKYDLHLTDDRTLRQAASELVRRSGKGASSDFWAVRDVSFELDRGETLGIIGRNGAGKSTLLLAIAGIVRPDTGLIDTFGRTATLLTLGSGFEPNLTGRHNIYLNAAYLGFSRAGVDERLDDIIAFSELDGFVDAPVRTYSTGMRTRLAFSIAAHIDPDILLLDEVLGVGDTAFQRKSKEKLEDLMRHRHAIVVVTHNVHFLTATCTKAIWMNDGEVAAFGDPDDIGKQFVAFMQKFHGPLRTTPGGQPPGAVRPSPANGDPAGAPTPVVPAPAPAPAAVARPEVAYPLPSAVTAPAERPLEDVNGRLARRPVIEVSTTEASRGMKQKVRFTAVEECDACGGNGVEAGSGDEPCGECGGTGEAEVEQFLDVRVSARARDGDRMVAIGPAGETDVVLRVVDARESRLVRYAVLVAVAVAVALFVILLVAPDQVGLASSTS